MYYIETLFVKLLLWYIRFHVVGRQNVPLHGPLLIVANHLSMVDPPIIGVTLGRKIIFMAKDELFRNWFIRFFITSFGAFPVYRGGYNLDTLRQARRVLAAGKALAMFPEGKRSMKVGLLPGFPGSALLAYNAKAPILPIGLHGTEKINGLIGFLKRPELTVNIGQPFYLPTDDKDLTREKLNEYTDIIMKRIAELLPPKYQGVYARKEG